MNISDKTKRLFLGAVLVLAGVIFLLQQIFNLSIGGLFVALLFAAGGAVFFYVFFSNREKWWALIPGFTLLGLAALIATSELFPAVSNRLGGSIFLGAIALSFVTIYLIRPVHWWPIIPAGVLATLAVVAGIRGNGMAQGALFFLGVGATFALIALLPAGKKEKWPWIPAGILLAFGILLLIGSGALINSFLGWVWALAFVAVGVFFIVRSFTKKE